MALILIKIGEWKREDYYLYPNGESQNDSNNTKNFVFSEKNDKSNAYGLNFDKNNNNNCIAIDINQKNKRKNNLIKHKNNNRLINLISVAKYIIIVNLLNNVFINNKISLFEYKSNKITLKIRGIGDKQIFYSGSEFKYHPNEEYINEHSESEVDHSYYLNKTENIIELIWDALIDNCGYIFYTCSDINEIDFSNFNTSQVTNMDYMLEKCTSLTSINFANFDTSNVNSITHMFLGCTLLSSLNLSTFDTSKVIYMNYMFSGCSSLVSIYLSSFNTANVQNMYCMFKGCSALTSLNLSNFDTSKVKQIYSMFANCINLEYINMINFKENSLQNDKYSDMFRNVPDNVV